MKPVRLAPGIAALAFFGCAGQTHTQSHGADAAARPSVELAKRPSDSTTDTAPEVDFRRQFIVAARAIRPAVVSIDSTAVVKASGQSSPFEGTPFEHFFRDLPELGPRLRRGVGSGVIVDPQGHVLTNNHVVAEADTVKVALADGHELQAKVIGADPQTDLAVVKIDPGKTKLQAAVLGDSNELEVGDWVIACGSPFGLRQTVSAGIISAIGRGNMGITEYEDFLQTDAAINPGNSGGPLVDLSGRVVGINTAIASASGGNAGVGFAIPIEMAAQVMRQLVDTGKVTRGYIGLYISDIRDDLAESFGYERAGGALVQDVSPGSPGAKSGLKAGDIIYERDGQPIASAADLRNGIAASKPGTTTQLSVWRDKKEIKAQVVLGEMPGGGRAGPSGDSPDAPVRWGLQLSNVPAQLRQGGAPAGALVQGVAPGSPADDAGLKPGDIVVNVAGKEVKSASDAQRELLAAKSPARVRVVRDGRGLFVMLSADD